MVVWLGIRMVTFLLFIFEVLENNIYYILGF